MNNNIIQLDSKSYLKAKVVMLNNKKSRMCILTHKIDNSVEFHLQPNNDAFIYENTNDAIIQPKHLYITIEEEIKEGDWCINKNLDTLYQVNGNNQNWLKVISSTDISLNLPQPNQDFIETYIAAYNLNIPIVDVLVEVEEIDKTSEYYLSKGIAHEYVYQLKLSSDNTITIKQVKDSYSREEVIKFATKAFDAGTYYGNCFIEDSFSKLKSLNPDILYSDKWIENNI